MIYSTAPAFVLFETQVSKWKLETVTNSVETISKVKKNAISDADNLE